MQNSMFQKLLLAVVAALIVGNSATAAHADAFSVVGNSNPNATATLNIISLSNNKLVISITNTSAGVVTGFGFALNGANASLVSASSQPSSQNFVFGTNVGNVPQFNNAALSFALVTHAGNFAGGTPRNGVQAGATSATFTFSGNFSGMTQQQIAMALYVRFQALSSNPNSDVGTVNCVPPSAVPEPTTMLLLGTGLAGVAGAVKKRRKMKS